MNFDFASFRRSVQSLEGQLSSIRSSVEELQRKRSNVMAAPVAKEDVKELMSGWVREAGASFTADLSASVQQVARTTSSFSNQGQLKQLSSFGAFGSNHSIELGSNELGQALCAFFGKTIRESLAKAVDTMEWPDGAITQAHRLEEVSRLDAQIGKLMAEEAEIINKAADVGINLG